MSAQPQTASTLLAPEQRSVHHQVVVVGGGNGGISVAARLRRAMPDADVAIVEPSAKHYYQPLWTLVGGGVFPKQKSERDEGDYIPAGVTWICDAVEELCAEENSVRTRDGRVIGYDFLVLSPGIQLDWHKIRGLKDAIGRDGVGSNYAYEYVDKTWQFIREFKGGNAIFTQPGTPIKCGGAPQKIAYLADDHFRRAGVRDRTRVTFASAGAGIFAVPKYAATLNKVLERKQFDVRFKHNLVEIRGEAKEAVFENLDSGEEVVLPYDMIHVTPPQSAPDFVKRSMLANEAGWIDVDAATLQSPRFPNVFALGDASSLPTSKTGAAIRKQAPVLVRNLTRAIEGEPLDARYDGYTACPIVTGYGKLVLAEFDYDGNTRETFPFDQSKERLSMYLFKKHALPTLYWKAIMKGRA